MAAPLAVGSKARMAPSPNLQTAIVAVNELTLGELGLLKKHIRRQRKSKFRLLDLAPELRNRVYYFAAIDAVQDQVRFGCSPALLTVCRQIREEFSSLYFSDAIMTLERWVERDPSRWERVTEQSTLKALLVSCGGKLGGQSADFRQRFGIGEEYVYHRKSFVSVYRGGQRLPVFGDVQGARGAVERYYGPSSTHKNFSILVFNAACREPSRLVEKSPYSTLLIRQDKEVEGFDLFD